MTEVVAALIRRENKILICRRPAHKARGLLWEFAGGKVERGETPQQALVRECREELAVGIEVGEAVAHTVYAYPDLTVSLTLFNAVIAEGEPKAIEHCELRWVGPERLGEYEFCPADVEIIETLVREAEEGR